MAMNAECAYTGTVCAHGMVGEVEGEVSFPAACSSCVGGRGGVVEIGIESR